MRTPRILFVGVDADAREGFRTELSPYGLNIVLCYRGEEALRIIESHDVDVLVLSIDLQDMSGFEACRRVRARKSELELPIVVYAPKDSATWRLASFRAGANIFAFEPIFFDRLYYVMRLLIGYRRAYKHVVPIADVLRMAGESLAENQGPLADVLDSGKAVLSKADAVGWTNSLCRVLSMEDDSRDIACETVRLVLDLESVYGSLPAALGRLEAMSADNAIGDELSKVFAASRGAYLPDAPGNPTADGIIVLVLKTCELILAGEGPDQVLETLLADSVADEGEATTLANIVRADRFMGDIFAG